MINVIDAAFGKVKPIAETVIRTVSPKLPEILLGTGISIVAGGCVVACVKSVKHVPRIIAETDSTISDIKDAVDDENELKHEITKIYAHSALELGKVYAVPVSMVCGGIACIIASHNIQHSKILAIGGAYNTLLASFNDYRENVRNDQGIDADRRYLYGTHEETIVEETTDKNGKVKKKEKTVVALGSSGDGKNGESLYHRCYSRQTSAQWINDAAYNWKYLTSIERNFTQKLHYQGYVFLDEVYEALGFDLDGYSNAKIVGWMLGMGDDRIDLGIYNPDADIYEQFDNQMAIECASNGKEKQRVNELMNGYDGKFWLDFNCDGVIYDKI